jgi:hypothetical protein
MTCSAGQVGRLAPDIQARNRVHEHRASRVALPSDLLQ